MMTANQPAHRIAFEAIGTHWEVDIRQELAHGQLQALAKQIKGRIAEFDKAYSRFRDDSTIMQLAQAPGRYELPDDAKPLLDFYEALYRITEGKVTPLVGDMLVQAGYDADYSLVPRGQVAIAPKWEGVMEYEYPYITTKQKAILDVGAAGKGYIIDIISALLKNEGIHSFLVDAGGDMMNYDQSQQPIRIGLEHPSDPSLAIGVVTITNESICGSAGSRRKWANMHHIIDPTTAESVRDILATWVVAETAMLADGLATALFFTPYKVLRSKFIFEYALVRADMSVEYSPGLRAELFGANDE